LRRTPAILVLVVGGVILLGMVGLVLVPLLAREIGC